MDDAKETALPTTSEAHVNLLLELRRLVEAAPVDVAAHALADLLQYNEPVHTALLVKQTATAIARFASETLLRCPCSVCAYERAQKKAEN